VVLGDSLLRRNKFVLSGHDEKDQESIWRRIRLAAE
jgi:hypothetical protein